MIDHIHVCVCVPNTGEWKNETAKSVALMFSYFAQNRVGKAKSQRLSLLTAEGSMLSQSRQNLVQKSLKAGCTHIMFVDSDMEFPMNTLNKLLERDKPFVALNATTRTEPALPVAHDLEGNRLSSKGKKGLEKVQHVGLAVALIGREVFARMEPPLFLMDWIPDRNAYCGEDVYFCSYAQSLGYDLWVDHDLSQSVGHVGKKVYGYDCI
jgi:hypothetical protein